MANNAIFDRIEQGEIILLAKRMLGQSIINPNNIYRYPFDLLDGGFAFAAGADGLDGGTSASNSTGYTIDGGTA